MNTTRIEFAPGHEDERLTDQDVAAKLRLMKHAPELLAALQWFVMLQPLPGEGHTECFERIADAFRRATGYLRPGKHCVMHSLEERQEAWDDWRARHVEAARAAIAKATGSPT